MKWNSGRSALVVSVMALVLAASGVTLGATLAHPARSTKVLTAIKGYVSRSVNLCPDKTGTVPPCSLQQVTAFCPNGWVATGGAFDNGIAQPEGAIAYRDGYAGLGYNHTTTITVPISASVYCTHVGRAQAASASGLPYYNAALAAEHVQELRRTLQSSASR